MNALHQTGRGYCWYLEVVPLLAKGGTGHGRGHDASQHCQELHLQRNSESDSVSVLEKFHTKTRIYDPQCPSSASMKHAGGLTSADSEGATSDRPFKRASVGDATDKTHIVKKMYYQRSGKKNEAKCNDDVTKMHSVIKSETRL